MPNLAGRLLQGAGAAGEQGHTHAWGGLEAAFAGMRNTKVHKTAWARFPEDFQARRSAGKWQPEGKSLEEPLAAGKESKEAGLPAEEERERARGWCQGLSAQRSIAKLLLWNKICWNVDTPIPE